MKQSDWIQVTKATLCGHDKDVGTWPLEWWSFGIVQWTISGLAKITCRLEHIFYQAFYPLSLISDKITPVSERKRVFIPFPSKHTTSFRCLCNVHNVKTTSYGCQNNVVCVLGEMFLYIDVIFFCCVIVLFSYSYQKLLSKHSTLCQHPTDCLCWR